MPGAKNTFFSPCATKLHGAPPASHRMLEILALLGDWMTNTMKRAPQRAVRPSGQIHLDGCHTTLEILFLIKIPLLGHGVVCMYLSCNVPYIEDSNKLKRGWTWTILSLITSSWSLLLVFYDALWFCSAKEILCSCKDFWRRKLQTILATGPSWTLSSTV